MFCERMKGSVLTTVTRRVSEFKTKFPGDRPEVRMLSIVWITDVIHRSKTVFTQVEGLLSRNSLSVLDLFSSCPKRFRRFAQDSKRHLVKSSQIFSNTTRVQKLEDIILSSRVVNYWWNSHTTFTHFECFLSSGLSAFMYTSFVRL